MNSLDYFQLVHPAVALVIAAGMWLLTLLALRDEGTAHSWAALNHLRALGYFAFFRSRRGLRLLLLCAHAAHVYQAWQAVCICRELGVRGGLTRRWALQTFLFGIGSLSLLHTRQEFMHNLKKVH